MNELAVATVRLARHFHPAGKAGAIVTALDSLDLNVPHGEVHGLLGPNGAGKTTLCKIISTVLLPSSGTAAVYGFDVVHQARSVRSLIGLVFGGERGLYTRLTAMRNLTYWAALNRVPRREVSRQVHQLLERVGLTDRANDRVETFSRGMKQRLHLARGLIGDPRLLILDEPTAGLDPVAAREFRSMVGQLRLEGRTVLVTTHDMAEAEAICDRVSLIDGGRLLGTADPRTIGGWLSDHERIDAAGVPEEVLTALAEMPEVAHLERQLGGVRIHTAKPGATRAVLRTLVDAGVDSVSTSRPSLEDVYLHVIGNRGLRV